MSKVLSDKVAVYIKTTSTATSMNRVGVFMDTLTINMNPTETEVGDVTEPVKGTDLESYKPSIDGTGKYDGDDPVYKLFKDCWREQRVLGDALYDVAVGYLFEDGTLSHADMYEGTTVVINSITLNAAAAFEVGVKLSMNKPPVKGSLTLSNNNKTATFTAATESEG